MHATATSIGTACEGRSGRYLSSGNGDGEGRTIKRSDPDQTPGSCWHSMFRKGVPAASLVCLGWLLLKKGLGFATDSLSLAVLEGRVERLIQHAHSPVLRIHHVDTFPTLPLQIGQSHQKKQLDGRVGFQSVDAALRQVGQRFFVHLTLHLVPQSPPKSAARGSVSDCSKCLAGRGPKIHAPKEDIGWLV